MQAYAVVETGGKQYRVEKELVLDIEQLDVQPNEEIELRNVLALSDGQTLHVGTPRIEGAMVKAQVLAQVRGRKVVAFKKKRRKGYKRKVGHRQNHTRIKISEIHAG